MRETLRDFRDGYAGFLCPACHEVHRIKITGERAWDWNGNTWRPTLAPSILVTGKHWLTDDEHKRVMRGETITPREKRCHSYVRDGMIEFLSDSLHPMAGLTVPLPTYGEPR